MLGCDGEGGADRGEPAGSGKGSVASGYLLAEFDHPDCPFTALLLKTAASTNSSSSSPIGALVRQPRPDCSVLVKVRRTGKGRMQLQTGKHGPGVAAGPISSAKQLLQPDIP